MKRLLLGLSLAIGASMLGPTPDAEARGWSKARRAKVQVQPQRKGFGVPELDPGAAGAAAVLVIGGVAYVASRRRKDPIA